MNRTTTNPTPKSWTYTKAALPDMGHPVIVKLDTGGTNIGMLKPQGTTRTWSTSIGKLGLDRIVAWCKLPPFDAEPV